MQLLVANWKMHKSADEATAFVAAFRPLLPAGPRASQSPVSAVQVVIAPPYTAIPAVVAVTQGTGIAVAGQDLYWEPEGAFTGEISGPMLAAAGCRYVIVGHSERRQYFGDTDATVARKLRAALAVNLCPIVCVGESLAERQAGETETVLGRQVGAAFANLPAADLARCVLAYEPIWAIGTGKTATPEIAQSAHAFLRARVGPAIPILYGGSIQPANFSALIVQPDIDGGLVGTASLDPAAFAALVRAAG